VAIFSVKKYLPKVDGTALIRAQVYHDGMFRSSKPSLVAAMGMLCLAACSEPSATRIVISRVAPAADPGCGAPEDARTMIVRALGDFPASESTAQSIALGDDVAFEIERFPVTTRMLEVEVRGFGGAVRRVGRSTDFSIDALGKDAVIPVFMAPLEGVCATGPSQVDRRRALLARAGHGVLVVGGIDPDGAALPTAEFYDPTQGAFLSLDSTLYGAGTPLGQQGSSLTTLSTGDVALVGGGATAFQLFDPATMTFGPPAFYREARGRHMAVALPDGRLYLAGGCSQVLGSGCATDSALRTSSVLDTRSGEIEQGPSLRRSRIDGAAFLEGSDTILLVGGVDEQGEPVAQAERMFLDGSPSELIDGRGGAAVQAESGAVWVGMAQAGSEASAVFSSIAPGMQAASADLVVAFADRDVQLVSLEEGSILSLGQAGAQRIRSLDGVAMDLRLDALQGRVGQRAIRLQDGSVLIVGGAASQDEPRSYVFRPSLVGPRSASASASFSSRALSEGLSARDATRVQIFDEEGAHLELHVGQGQQEYLLVSGPHVADVSIWRRRSRRMRQPWRSSSPGVAGGALEGRTSLR
jgi:hypothetical protein